MTDSHRPVRIGRSLAPWLLLPAILLLACNLRAGAAERGENLALGKPYRLSPQPGYRHCTDPGDREQLTDGKTTTDYFWTQQGTVGWQSVQYATITIDLGRIEPIGGVALTTAAGTAGVTWPASIRILVSDDGKTYRDAGDLVALDHKHNGPWPEGYAIRRLVTHDLKTRGRYVRFLLIPMPGGPYTFSDEVEVFRGPDELLEKEPVGQPVAEVKDVFLQWRTRASIAKRFQDDAAAIRTAIREAPLADESVRKQLLDAAAEASGELDPDAVAVDDSFRAVLPLNVAHGRLFSVQAVLWQALDRPPLAAWPVCAWDPLDPFALPPKSTSGSVSVHTMLGEYRSAAINLANGTDRPMRVFVDPGVSKAEVTVYEVEWTDTSRGKPIAAALCEAPHTDRGWQVQVLPGLVRQVWLTFHIEGLPPGDHRRTVAIKPEQGEPVEVPIELHVVPLRFPEKATLWVGGWSYTNGPARYGVTPQNRDAFIDHLRDRFVNAPWAGSGVLMKFKFTGDDSIELDTAELDDWISRWPDARAYLVFLSVAHYSGSLRTTLGGAEIGSPEFDRRVGTWISAWVRHLKAKGIDPGQLGLLIHDEPHEGSDISPLLAWARAIRQAEPDVLIWEDPTYRNPAAAPPELFEACDVLCPNRPMWLQNKEAFEDFYGRQRAEGRTLHSYSCSGPAKLLDPYSYHRLQAWHCWRYGGTGSFFWAYGDNGGASSWNEYLARSGPYTPLFLDDTTVTAGKHMEAIRESAEDYECLVMLRDAVDRAKAAGRSDAAVSRAEELLNTAAAEVVEAEGVDNLQWHDPKDRTVADRVRVQILEALVALKPPP